jgi:hypothetical protein
VFAGHAALAMVAKGKRPAISIAVLVPVAFGPDWIKLAGEWFGNTNAALSHSLVSVGIGATGAAIIYYATTRAAVSAAVVWLTYLSHWPADFITGLKPTWPGGPTVGLMLYAHPAADVVVESVLVVIGWVVYRRSLPEVSKKRMLIYLVPLGLIGMQVLFGAIESPDAW